MSEEYLPYAEMVEDVLRPLETATNSTQEAEALLRELGYAPPSEVLAFAELSAAVDAITDLIAAIRAAVSADDNDELIKQLLEFAVQAGRAFKSLNDFQTKIQRNFAGSQFLVLTDVLATIPERLVDYILVKYLEDFWPTVNAVLMLVGIVEIEDIDDAPNPFVVPYRKRSINWDQFGNIFNDPLGALESNFDAGDEFVYERLLYLVRELGLGLGLMPAYGSPQPGTLTTMNQGGDLSAINATEELPTLYFPILSDPTLGVGVDLYPLMDPGTAKYTGAALALRAAAALDFPLSASWGMQLKVSANVKDGLGVRMAKGHDPTFVSSLFSGPSEMLAATTFGASFTITRRASATNKMVALGAPGGCRFEIGSGSFSFGVEKLDAFKLYVEADLKDGLVSLKADNPDGFLAKILPEDGIQADFSLGVGVSSQAGLYFKGSSSLVIHLPVHIELGPIGIDNLAIGLTFEAPKFPLSVTTDLSAELGPLSLVVEDVGVRATFETKADRSGNLGPFDASFAFKPPKGVGIAINAGAVKGGGYLFFDSDAGEYAGALELSIGTSLSLKAIGLITTRMPDGSKGFSMIIIITAEFDPGIQLGYGFTLNGVGGLLGLNRTVVIDALAAGVRTGAVAELLFPVDPVANAPRIISDIKAIFPPTPEHFLIGPMAKIGWGDPTLVTIELGIVIEIPGNVAILGVIKVVLPDEDADILHLQVNFVGVIEFDKKRGWFFAALFDSRLLFITLEGEMGLLMAFGADANFVMTVGGFHPQYPAPALPFPTPKRITFDIVNTSYCKIRADAYFAITTNAAMFGAHAQLFFGYDSFSVEGHMALDALLRFSPFYFIVQISAGMSLKVFGIGAFGIDLDFTLEGTSPWRARGHGSISILFFSVSKDFDETWGEVADTSLPPIALIPLMQAELESAANWRSVLPTGGRSFVTLATVDAPAGTLILHPLGTIEFSQAKAPLAFDLERVGAQKPSDANRFEAELRSAGLSKRDDAKGRFAPAQFRNMTDAQKLSAPAFQSQISGIQVSVAGGDMKTGISVQRIVRYQVSTIDTLFRRHVQAPLAIGAGFFNHLARGAAVSKVASSMARQRQANPFSDSVVIGEGRFAVAYGESNRAYTNDSTSFATPDDARDYMAGKVASDPSLGGQLHVLPSEELAA